MAPYTRQKVVRITDEQEKLLADEAKRQGCSESDVLRKCIANFGSASQRDAEEPAPMVLVEQLATKDEQIAALLRALEAAQETARAAQALHAAQGGALAGADGGAARLNRWDRLKRAWKG